MKMPLLFVLEEISKNFGMMSSRDKSLWAKIKRRVSDKVMGTGTYPYRPRF
jgi:hypothetical protein